MPPTEPPIETMPGAILSGPKTTAHRLALGAVILLGILILLGITILIIGLAKGWNRPAARPAGSSEEQALAGFHKPVSMSLQPGFRILSSDTQPGRLILHIRSDTSDEIWVIDTTDGRIVAVIHGDAPKQ